MHKGRPGGWSVGSTAGKPLTDRELEVLKMAACGLSNAKIADALHLSEATVKRHLANVYEKTNVGSRGEATSKAWRRAGSTRGICCPRRTAPTGAGRGRGTVAPTSSAAARWSSRGPPRRPPGGPRVPRTRDDARRPAYPTNHPNF